ncbi:Rtr1/RPAP2 family-domain-containing protein [Entophlyctis helioformis]|nr:Rtr1/RPAP2 family-domain-containing protein [Entophlyctis helioformis]
MRASPLGAGNTDAGADGRPPVAPGRPGAATGAAASGAGSAASRRGRGRGRGRGAAAAGTKASTPALDARRKAAEQSARARIDADKSVSAAQELLFEGAVDAATVQSACRLLTPETYSEVVQEREAQRLCGYPPCGQKTNPTKAHLRIDLKDRKVYDITALKAYCCTDCFSASTYLVSQLSLDPVYMRDLSSGRPVDVLPPRTPIGDVYAARSTPHVSVDAKAATVNAPSERQLVHNYIDTLIASLPNMALGSDEPLTIRERSDDALETAAEAPEAQKELEVEPSTAARRLKPASVVAGSFDEIEGYKPSIRSSRRQPPQQSQKPEQPPSVGTERAPASSAAKAAELETTPPNGLSVSKRESARFLRFADPIEAPSEAWTAIKEPTAALPSKPSIRPAQEPAAIAPTASAQQPKRLIEQQPQHTAEQPKPSPTAAVVPVQAKVAASAHAVQPEPAATPKPTAKPAAKSAPLKASATKGKPIADADGSDEEDDDDDDDDDELFNGDEDDENDRWLRPSKTPVKPTLSIFGRMWVLVDRVVTPKTRLLLRHAQAPAAVFERGAIVFISSDDDHGLRKDIFAGKLLKTLRHIRREHKLDWDMDHEMLCIIDTLALGKATTMLPFVEEWILCVVFMRLLCRAKQASAMAANEAAGGTSEASLADVPAGSAATHAAHEWDWTRMLKPTGLGLAELDVFVRMVMD